MTYFAKKLKMLMDKNNVNLEYLSNKTGINQVILEAYLLDMEPDPSNLEKLSDFFDVSISELFFKHNDYKNGTSSNNNKLTKIYIGFIIILSVISILNILFTFVTSDTQTGLLVQTIITATSFMCRYTLKYYKDVSSFIKVKYMYLLDTFVLSANLYILLIHLLYGYSSNSNIFISEMFIVILLFFISIGFTISILYIIKHILSKFNPTHLYLNRSNQKVKLIISSYIVISTVWVYGSTNLWAIDPYTPRLSFVIFTMIYSYGPVIIFSFLNFLNKNIKDNKNK